LASFCALGSLTSKANKALTAKAALPKIPYVVLHPNYLMAIIEIDERPHPT
jgi:hypothetical protein